jgi:hypothetical protein
VAASGLVGARRNDESRGREGVNEKVRAARVSATVCYTEANAHRSITCTHARELRVRQRMRNLRARASAMALMHVFGFGFALARSADNARPSHFDIMQPCTRGDDADRMPLRSGDSSMRPLQCPRVDVRHRVPSSRECPSFDVCTCSQCADSRILPLHVSTLMQICCCSDSWAEGEGRTSARTFVGGHTEGNHHTPDTTHERRKKQRGRERVTQSQRVSVQSRPAAYTEE